MPNLFLLSAYSIIWEKPVLVPPDFPAGAGGFPLFFKDFPIRLGYAPVRLPNRPQILFSAFCAFLFPPAALPIRRGARDFGAIFSDFRPNPAVQSLFYTVNCLF